MRDPTPSPPSPIRDRPAFVLFTLIVAYGSLYLCRANVDSSFPLLAKTFGYTKTELGYLASLPITVYAIGKLLLGTLGEIVGGRRLLLLAAWGSVAATFAFGASGSLGAFIAFACLNRFFQSGGWSGAVNVVAHRFERGVHGRVMGVLSTSYELGNVAAIGLCAAVTWISSSWRPLFVVNPLVLAAAAVFVGLSLRGSPARAPQESPPRLGAPSEAVDERPLLAVLAALAEQPAFWVTLALSALLTFLRVTFLTWTATYLADLAKAQQGVAISGAIAKSAIFPAAGVVAALAIGPLSDRFGPGRRAPVMAASLAVVVVFVLALGHGGVSSPIAAAVLVGGVGLFLLGPYSLLAGAIALDVSNKRGSSAAAGMVDAAGYLGATLAGAGLGHIADTRGWSAAFDVVATAALLAALISGAWAVAIRRRPPAPAAPAAANADVAP